MCAVSERLSVLLSKFSFSNMMKRLEASFQTESKFHRRILSLINHKEGAENELKKGVMAEMGSNPIAPM